MHSAVLGLARMFDLFITPMAAVAGAVAEHIADVFERPGIARALGQQWWRHRAGTGARHRFRHRCRGGPCHLAWGPPSVSMRAHRAGASPRRAVMAAAGPLGIADSVTVLADDAPAADWL
jgi:hypothetical protein